MAHIHEKIDFTVAIVVVHEGKVLLIHHRQLDTWLPLGGHIELDEDPEQAALREAREESGLDVELLGERPPTTEPGTRALITPRFLDIHRISDTHEHIGLIYWARPKSGATTLAVEERCAGTAVAKQASLLIGGTGDTPGQDPEEDHGDPRKAKSRKNPSIRHGTSRLC